MKKFARIPSAFVLKEKSANFSILVLFVGLLLIKIWSDFGAEEISRIL